MHLLVSTLVGLGIMALGLPNYRAVLHDLDMLSKHRQEKAREAMRQLHPQSRSGDA